MFRFLINIIKGCVFIEGGLEEVLYQIGGPFRILSKLIGNICNVLCKIVVNITLTICTCGLWIFWLMYKHKKLNKDRA